MCARILKSGKGRSRKAADGLNLRGKTGKRGEKRDQAAEAVELLPLNKKIPTDGCAASKNGEEMRDESRLLRDFEHICEEIRRFKESFSSLAKAFWFYRQATLIRYCLSKTICTSL